MHGSKSLRLFFSESTDYSGGYMTEAKWKTLKFFDFNALVDDRSVVEIELVESFFVEFVGVEVALAVEIGVEIID